MAVAKKAAAKKAPAKAAKAKAPPQKRKPLTEALELPARGSRASSRVKLADADDDMSMGEAASTYFANVDEKSGLTFVSSGAALIDSIFGGGYPCGRVVNIVGDKSAGKTLLAIEACANFRLKFKKDPIRYAEAEAAFDEAYAGALGMPVGSVDFGNKDEPLRTIEDWYKDCDAFITKCEGKRGLYIIDSLDALSDDAEMKRDIDDGTYGTKAKKLGEFFRRLVARLEESQVLLIVISQLRDKLNAAAFGEKQTRSGGRALDFYASIIVWLAEIGKIKQTQKGVERVVGVNVRARVKKNKVGLPFRECDYPILFGYGIDDMTASAEWLLKVGRADMLRSEVGMSKDGYKIRIAALRDRGGPEAQEVRAKLAAIVKREWQIIEMGFLPKASKY